MVWYLVWLGSGVVCRTAMAPSRKLAWQHFGTLGDMTGCVVVSHEEFVASCGMAVAEREELRSQCRRAYACSVN